MGLGHATDTVTCGTKLIDSVSEDRRIRQWATKCHSGWINTPLLTGTRTHDLITMKTSSYRAIRSNCDNYRYLRAMIPSLGTRYHRSLKLYQHNEKYEKKRHFYCHFLISRYTNWISSFCDVIRVYLLSVVFTAYKGEPLTLSRRNITLIHTNNNDSNFKKTLMQSIKYAAKIVCIWVLFYWRGFEEQQAHGPHLLTWVNRYKSLSMHFSLLLVMFYQIILSVAIATNQIQRFGLNAYIL